MATCEGCGLSTDRGEVHSLRGGRCIDCLLKRAQALEEDLSVARQSLYAVAEQRNTFAALDAEAKAAALQAFRRWWIWTRDIDGPPEGAMADFTERLDAEFAVRPSVLPTPGEKPPPPPPADDTPRCPACGHELAIGGRCPRGCSLTDTDRQPHATAPETP